MTSSSSGSNNNAATHYRAATKVHGRYVQTHTLVRRAAAYGTIITTYQVKILCCETTSRCLRTKKRNDNSNTMNIKLTSRLLRRHLNHNLILFLPWNKKKGNVTHKKNIILYSNHGRLGQRDSNRPVHLLRFYMIICQIDVSIRMHE